MSGVTVIGGGVVGLTVAVVLAEGGFNVSVVTKEHPLHTTSANSGAIWGPFLSGIDDRVLSWSYETLTALNQIAEDSSSGVAIVGGMGARPQGLETDWWVSDFDGAAVTDPSGVPSGYSEGWSYRVPIVDMPVYLTYLHGRFSSASGSRRMTLRELSTLDQVDQSCDNVVVCAGLGAGPLVNDQSLFPSVGELVVVENPGIERFFAEQGDGPDLTYILPQGHQVVLGGTARDGADLVSTRELAKVHDAIVFRCSLIDPRLGQSRILGYRRGFRPCRPKIRLEHHMDESGRHIVYNYGHGGSGVSLSWGCAKAVRELLVECGGEP